jgi:hypothetical protein
MEWIEPDLIPEQRPHYGMYREQDELRARYTREQFAYWQFDYAWSGCTVVDATIRALSSMGMRDIPVRPVDCDKILGLPPGTTTHEQVAEEIREEFEKRNKVSID